MSVAGIDFRSLNVSQRELAALGKFLKLKASNKYDDGLPGGLGLLIEKNAAEFPDRPAVHFEGADMTYAELNRACNRVANFFLEMGAKKGMTCALFLESSADYITVLAGLAKIGVVSSLLNTGLKKQPLIHVVNISKADWIVVHESLLDRIEEIIGDISVPAENILVLGGPRDERFQDLDQALQQVAEDNPKLSDPPRMHELAWYLFTSGTTGMPKAVKCKYKTQLFSGEGIYIIAAPCSKDDVFYSPLPLNHVMGLITFCGAMQVGAQFVLRKKFSASNYWDDVRKHKATVGSYIGEIPRYLYNLPPRPDDADNPLRKFVGLGLKAELWEKFKQRFAIEEIYEVYGASEGGTQLINIAGAPGMVGRLFNPAAALAKYDTEKEDFALDENGHMIRCQKPGEMGILIVSKTDPSININDYTDEKATDKKILRNVFAKGDAWFNTGDLFLLHEGLFLSFKDRLGDTFRWKSENVSTQEVESILMEYPGIELTAVYGVEVPDMPGKAGMAAIIKTAEHTWDWEEFDKYVSDNLPHFAIPRFIRFVEDIELTSTHKINKTTLREEAFDLARIKDPLYYRDCAKAKYYLIDEETSRLIKNGKVSL